MYLHFTRHYDNADPLLPIQVHFLAFLSDRSILPSFQIFEILTQIAERSNAISPVNLTKNFTCLRFATI